VLTKLVSRQITGLAAQTDPLDIIALISLAPGGSLTQGQPLCADITRIPNIQPALSVFPVPNPVIPLGSYLSVNPRQAGLTTQVTNLDLIETVVLPTSANAGPLVGVYQGPTITNPATAATAFFPIDLRVMGYGLVLAGALTAGVAVATNGQLVITTFPSAANAFATQVAKAAIAPGTNVGICTAFLGQYVSSTSIAAGSSVVTPTLQPGTTAIVGILSGTANILIDTLASGVQESVTTTAVTATTFTATFVNAHAINAPIVWAVNPSGTTLLNTGLGTVTGIVQAYINIG